jgi:hypothetical protein
MVALQQCAIDSALQPKPASDSWPGIQLYYPPVKHLPAVNDYECADAARTRRGRASASGANSSINDTTSKPQYDLRLLWQTHMRPRSTSLRYPAPTSFHSAAIRRGAASNSRN